VSIGQSKDSGDDLILNSTIAHIFDKIESMRGHDAKIDLHACMGGINLNSQKLTDQFEEVNDSSLERETLTINTLTAKTVPGSEQFVELMNQA